LDHQHHPETIASAFRRIQEIVTDYYSEPERDAVLKYTPKEAMIEAFEEPVPPEEGLGLDAAIDLFRDRVLPASVKTWHPLFVNQMSAGATMPSLVAEMLASMMNPTMATYEAAPAGTIIERNVTRWMADILGMPKGSGGILLPGGSISNLLALSVARNRRLDRRIAREGLGEIDQRGVILCSAASHYSVANAANLLGLGTNRVIKVATNERNEMKIDSLRAEIDRCGDHGLRPFALVATMGITVTGGFDPLWEIAAICREHDIHLHVDAAFGGSMALTREGKGYFRGIEYADTVLWDAHKWMHVPLTCTSLLAPDPGVFKEVFSSNANYLFHPREDDLDLADDLGQYTILCGKRFDGLCMWFLFKAFGKAAYQKMAEERLATTLAIARIIEDSPDFELSYEPRSPLICLRYLPPEINGCSAVYRDRLQRSIREECKRRGLGFFNIAELKGEEHLRMVLNNQLTTVGHIETLLEELRRLGHEQIVENPPEVFEALV